MFNHMKREIVKAGGGGREREGKGQGKGGERLEVEENDKEITKRKKTRE